MKEKFVGIKDYLPSEKNFQSKDKHRHTRTHLYTHLHTHTHTRTSGPNMKRKENILKEMERAPFNSLKTVSSSSSAWLEQQSIFAYF